MFRDWVGEVDTRKYGWGVSDDGGWAIGSVTRFLRYVEIPYFLHRALSEARTWKPLNLEVDTRYFLCVGETGDDEPH